MTPSDQANGREEGSIERKGGTQRKEGALSGGRRARSNVERESNAKERDPTERRKKRGSILGQRGGKDRFDEMKKKDRCGGNEDKRGIDLGGGDGGDRNKIGGMFGGSVGDARIVVRKERPYASFFFGIKTRMGSGPMRVVDAHDPYGVSWGRDLGGEIGSGKCPGKRWKIGGILGGFLGGESKVNRRARIVVLSEEQTFTLFESDHVQEVRCKVRCKGRIRSRSIGKRNGTIYSKDLLLYNAWISHSKRKAVDQSGAGCDTFGHESLLGR